jgi:hypothetical protein
MRITDFTELTTPTSNDLLVVVDVVNDITKKLKLSSLPVPSSVTTALATKQDSLVSGVTIKTINSTSLLGSGNITIAANPSGVAGAIQFSDGSAFASDATKFFWDNTNKRLGVGTNTPTQALDVVGSIAASSSVLVGGLMLQSNFLWGQSSGIRLRVDAPSLGGVAVNTTPISNVTTLIRGWGATSATTSLLVQNSAGVASLQVLDDTSVFNYGKGAITSNTAFGNGALINNTTGSQNTAIGSQALLSNSTGTFNTANGLQALLNNTTGGFNTANGVSALRNNNTGSNNTANGVNALLLNTTGTNNTAIGRDALQNNTASNNTAVGFAAGNANTSATGITAIGYQALTLSTGANNTALGFQAGDNITTGAGNVCIGSGAEPLAATDSNQFVVGTATINAGSVTTESNLSLKVWNVIINGVAQKILLA